MAFYMNPAKRFSDSITLTTAPVKTPKNTREALFIHKAYPNGIFQIENSKGAVLYDRCYTFTDISYVNKDDEDKANVLLSLMDFLKGMSTSFKITVSNQYQNMTQFVNDIFTDINRSDYPEVSEGISMWIKEKMENSDLHDLNRVLTLTITVRTRTYDEARSYFLGMDTELERLFSAMRSIIVPMKAEQRLNMIRNFFYQEEKKEYDFNHDALYDVIPVSVDQYRDFMMFNNDTYVSVLFARDFDTALDDGKLIHTISDTSYQSFVTIDYAPVEHSVTRSMLRSAYGNNERAISQEADSKKSNNQAVTGISYSKKKKRAELEGYMDQLDDDSEECIQAGLLVVVTAGSEDELAARIESMQRTAKNVGAYLETYNYVQLKAFNTALPTGVRQVKKMRSFYTSSLVALQPFFAPEVTEPGGIFYGINNTTKNLVFANGKVYTLDLAIAFAEEKSGGKQVAYKNQIAINYNGGWRYAYGNMFYAQLVNQYIYNYDNATVQKIVDEAMKYSGWDYISGGSSPDDGGFDCSGLVQYVYGKAGINLPRLEKDQYEACEEIEEENIQPGDLIFYKNETSNGEIGHVAIYLGNGKVFEAGDPIGIYSATDEWHTSNQLHIGRVKGIEDADSESDD